MDEQMKKVLLRAFIAFAIIGLLLFFVGVCICLTLLLSP